MGRPRWVATTEVLGAALESLGVSGGSPRPVSGGGAAAQAARTPWMLSKASISHLRER